MSVPDTSVQKLETIRDTLEKMRDLLQDGDYEEAKDAFAEFPDETGCQVCDDLRRQFYHGLMFVAVGPAGRAQSTADLVAEEADHYVQALDRELADVNPHGADR